MHKNIPVVVSGHRLAEYRRVDPALAIQLADRPQVLRVIPSDVFGVVLVFTDREKPPHLVKLGVVASGHQLRVVTVEVIIQEIRDIALKRAHRAVINKWGVGAYPAHKV